ncbi:uncharacterized protein LOC144643626 isoform X2 [Oculina patagonica]
MYAFRQAELVGKRFLCVRVKNAHRPNSRSSRVSNPLDYQWKVGVIRACNETDFHHPELKVLVEYDNEEWTTREWLKIHDGSWKLFLVEQTMVWTQRPDPSNPRRPLLWPALTFAPLVDKHGLKDEERPVPVEFVGDHERAFVRSDEFRPYGQDDDALQPALRNNSVVMNELRSWQRLQKSQSILMDGNCRGPFTLTGFRVQVYRQTCRQWFSAVITAHDIMSRELSVMDDTVLQTHRVNPKLIQVILLANEAELDSLLRGELNVVRVLPMRQHRHSQVIITAPLATQTTSSSLPSVAPTTWQLYAGLTQATNSNNLANGTQSVYQTPVTSTSTRLSTASSPVNSQGPGSSTKERRKSSETRNRSSASRRSTRSDSANSPPSANDTPQQTPQTPQSSFTSSSSTPLMSSLRTVTPASSQLSNKTSPPEAHMSPAKNSSSSSSVGSPSSLPKKSPIKQPMSPKTSPTVLSYNSSPASNAGMSSMGSPFRANPFCSSPDLSSVASMASPIAGMSHMGMRSPGRVAHSRAQSPHPLYSHTMGHLNISPSQLYALQLQQQQQQQQMQQPENQEYLSKLRHQHYQSLMHQYQMHRYQLDLMVQQQELIQQMPLTAEQQHILAEHYNQLLYQYQCAQIFQQLAAATQEEQLSLFHPIDEGELRTLPERIQQQLREDQERQKRELQNLMPKLEPEQLQTFFTCLQQQSMTVKEIQQLYTALLQQQEAQRRPTQAQRELPADEQQEQKLQQYLQQNQEQLQKFLQLPKSPSFLQDVKPKEEPKQEAATSSSSPPQNVSPSPSFSPSPNSSFTVHHLPSPSATASSSNTVSEDKPESDPCVGSSTLDSPRQQPSQSVDEIDLASTTAEGQSYLEKLLQHHKKAIEESRQETSAKARRSKGSSERSKRQRRSTESNTSIQNKDDSAEKKDNKKTETCPSVSASSTEDSSSSSSLLTVRVEDCLVNSVKQTSSEDKNTVAVNNKLQRNLGIVDSPLVKDKNQDKTGNDLAAVRKDGDKTPLKVPEQTLASIRVDNVNKMAPNVPSGNESNGASLEGAAPWVPEEATYNAAVEPCPSAKATDPAEISKVSQDLEKDKTTVLTQRGSEKVLAKDITTKGPKTTDLLCTEKVLSRAPAKEGSNVPNSKFPDKRKEWLQLTTVRGAKKASAIPSKDISKTPPLSFNKNSFTGSANHSVNISEKNDSESVASEAMQVDTPAASQKQKPSLSSEVKPVIATNCFSLLSSNSADHNGEVFGGEGLKTYSKKSTPNKRKSISRESSVEDNSTVSKVLKIDNKESSEVEHVKNVIHENSKMELAKRLNKKLANSKAEEQTSNRLPQNSVTPTERSKPSRKKSTDESKVQSKKAKCEENKSNNESADAVQNKPVTRLELKANATTRTEEDNVVDSVSFVADQVVDEVSVNHSPTVKEMPGNQFEAVDATNNQRLNSRSRERIREMTFKKKQLKAKEEKRRERKKAKASEGLPTVTNKEPETTESLETVVDSVLDEEIPVIYNAEDEKIDNKIKAEEKSTKKTATKKESTTTNRRVGRPRRKEKKHSESDGDAVSPTSEQFFLQDRVCSSLPNLPKCRDCRDIVGETTGLECCRFNSFRRLKKKKNGTISAAGFQLPDHAATEDFHPWVAQDKVERLDKKTSLYILFNVGDQFCSVMQEEKNAVTLAETDGKQVSVAYKRAVQGVREMCDVCATTIFNMHWVCHRCGFGVCLDCYNLRVQERERQSGLVGKRVFEFKWVMCCPGICHQPKYLSVAQIIPKTVLSDLGDELHRAREAWKIGKTCPCKSVGGNHDNNESGAKITELSNEETTQHETNGVSVSGEEASDVTVKTETSSISSSSNQTGGAVDSESSFEDDVNLICDEKMGLESPADHEQEWLTEEKRRNHFTKKAGFGLVEAKPQRDKKVSSGLSLLMDYSSSTEASPCESPVKDVKPETGMFNFSLGGNGGNLCGLDLLVLACERNGEYINSIGLNSEGMKETEKPKRAAPQSKQGDKEMRNHVSPPVATTSESTSAECSDEVRVHAVSPTPDVSDSDACVGVPHSWLCDGRLLRLHDPRAPGNVKAFESRWKKGEPVLVSQVDKYLNLDIWTPKSFGEEFGDEISDVVNCRNGVVVERFKVGDFWKGFESIKDRPLDSNGEPMLLKLKDWPPKDDFSEKLPTRFEDLMNNVPLPEYTRRDGSRNLVSRLPDFFVKPDLGPKMYNAYGSAACPKEGTTNLHLDMSDAVNIMVYVGVPKDQGAGDKEREDAIKAVDEACDESQRKRVRQETARIGALWHIYAAEDADKIRDCLRVVAKERKMKYSAHHDPIHDQCFYLDHGIRQRLKKDYGVEGWAICQCLGDSVFIPAGAPHQVRNLYSCVKVAEDFVSPERIDHCFRMTQEFRHLSDKHTNHEDKLQVKNIIYHAVKDALDSLKHYEHKQNSSKEQMESEAVL